ncbi:MAG: hypothetical protein ABIG96_04845 [Candidatus Micrarchaeota archaeon]
MRQIAVLVAVLLFALLFNSLIPRQSGTQLDRETVERFILEDAKTTYGEKAAYKLVKYEEKEGKFFIEMDISMRYTPQPGANTYCTKTLRRYYSLFPISFREEFYSSDC